MRILRFVAGFFIFLFLQIGVETQFPSGEAYAYHCCPCGSTCWYNCACRGSSRHCPVCGYRNTNTAESTTSIANPIVIDIRSVRDLALTDQATYLMKVGDCARRNLALKVLGDLGERLKVESFFGGKITALIGS